MRARLHTMLRTPLVPISVTLAALAVVGWVVVVDDDQAAAPTATPAPGVHLIQALERVPTDSLADWVGVADHVVVATVVDEVRGEDPPVDETAPNGEGLIQRTLSFEVDDVLWSAAGVGRPAPDSFTILTDAGWIRYEDGSERETAREGSSRLEVGNEYVLGLVWKPAQCAGDIRIPARWALIGSGAVLPANDGVVGEGEFEGAEVSPVDAGEVVGPPVAEEFRGEGVEDVEEALDDTRAADEVDFVSEAELCS